MKMSIRIEVKSLKVDEVSGTSKAGKPYHIRKQTGWAHTYDASGTQNPYPEKIEFNLAENQAPFALGVYTIAPESFYVGDFNALSIGRLILTLLPAQRPATALAAQ
jgi:hypothetical protein